MKALGSRVDEVMNSTCAPKVSRRVAFVGAWNVITAVAGESLESDLACCRPIVNAFTVVAVGEIFRFFACLGRNVTVFEHRCPGFKLPKSNTGGSMTNSGKAVPLMCACNSYKWFIEFVAATKMDTNEESGPSLSPTE